MNTHVVHDHSDVEDLEALYRQRPLPRNTKSIRLIDISSSSQFVSEIKGSLRVVDLDAEPHFTALSYVWGAMVPEPHHVNCGGFRIKITENGHCALRHLRKKLGNFTIWVDALCINQADVAEKSHQVPLMADIYSKAASVFVWLGESDAGTDRAMAWLPTAGFIDFHFAGDRTRIPPEGISRPRAAAWAAQLRRRNPTCPFPSKGLGLLLNRLPIISTWCMAKHATDADLRNLLLREWTTRMWTYQEIVLATHPILVCGHSHLPWSQFQFALIFLHCASTSRDSFRPWFRILLSKKHVPLALSPPRPVSEKSLLDSYETFLEEMFIHWYKLEKIRLVALGLLIVAAHFISIGLKKPALGWIFAVLLFVFGGYEAFTSQVGAAPTSSNKNRKNLLGEDVANAITYGLYDRRASEPKDMAFGFWAILQKWSHDQLPAPNYLDSVGHTYKVFTTYLIKSIGTLEPLLLAAVCNMDGEASWVPDWSKKQHDFSLGQRRLSYFYAHTFSSEPSAQAQPTWDASGNVLSIRARVPRTLSETFKFRKTLPVHDELEAGLLFHNHRLILSLYVLWSSHQKAAGVTINVSSLDFAEFLRAAYDRCLTKNGITPVSIPYWSKFVGVHSKLGLEQSWSLLTGAGSMRFHGKFHNENRMWAPMFGSIRYADILQTQITICNRLATSKRCVVATPPLDVRQPAILGYASKDAAVGDSVAVIEELGVSLIIRTRESSSSEGRIVSPAVFRCWPWTRECQHNKATQWRFETQKLDIY